MTNFPLYDNIVTKLEENHANISEPIQNTDKIKLADFVKTSNQNVHEFIYMLIKVHQLKADSTSSTNLPYNGKEQKSGLKFDIDNIPSHLQHILLAFYTMQDQDADN
jgi:hypothetical protein